MRMRNKRTLAWLTAVVVAAAVGVSYAQQNRATTGPTLTAADYVEIQQLVARYGYAVDTHLDNGYGYADLFTADGVFGGTTVGREQLAALARQTQAQRAGPSYTRHFLTNVIIKPAAEGATGSQYLIAIDVGEGGRPSTIVHGGRYEDVYVKTPQGWRFKSRTLIPSRIGTRPPASTAR